MDVLNRKHVSFFKSQVTCFSDNMITLAKWANNLRIFSGSWSISSFYACNKQIDTKTYLLISEGQYNKND